MERELKTASMSVKVTPSFKARYQEKADALGIDLSACISMALVQWLNSQELTQAVNESIQRVLASPEGIDVMLKHIDQDALPDVQLELPLEIEEG